MLQITVDKTCRNNQALASTWSEYMGGNTSASPNSAVTRQEKWKADSGNAEWGKIKGSAARRAPESSPWPVLKHGAACDQQISES